MTSTDSKVIRDEDAETTLYFAFGSNLSITQMQQRCPSSCQPLAIAKLSSYAWFICDRGYANVIAVPPLPVPPASRISSSPSAAPTPSAESRLKETTGSTVWGIIYRLTKEDESSLDVYEGWNERLRGVENSNDEERIWKPFSQGDCSYNKFFLLVEVVKWLVPIPTGISAELLKQSSTKKTIDISAAAVAAAGDGDANDSPVTIADEVGRRIIRALVYVDEVRTKPGRIKYEYIRRMSRAMAESIPLGIPSDWADEVMKQHGIDWRRWIDENEAGQVVDESEAHLRFYRAPPRELWEKIRNKNLLEEG